MTTTTAPTISPRRVPAAGTAPAGPTWRKLAAVFAPALPFGGRSR